MKIINYSQFINEDYQDTPEEYIKTALMKLKKTIDSFFDVKEQEESDSEVMSVSKAMKKGKEMEEKNSKISFKELNVSLESSEMSKYSAIYDSLKIIFSDDEFRYDLFVTIPLESGMNKEKAENFSDKDIKECFVKFKKYDLDRFDLIGQIGPKKVKIESINEEFLINLKIELDDEFDSDNETLEFET